MSTASSSRLVAPARSGPHPAGRRSFPDPSACCDQTGCGREASFRRRSERRGRLAEWLAAVILMCKGYRIVARRARTPYGELDLIAVRGRRLAFIEVKYRDSLDLAARAVGRGQAIRIARAAEHWAWARPGFRRHRLGLDGFYLAPWCLPRHRIDDLQPL